jgi:hypothetical protein
MVRRVDGSSPSEGLRHLPLRRARKIVEQWDVLQWVPETTGSGKDMFSSSAEDLPQQPWEAHTGVDAATATV